jgi:hypothetical protein
MCKNMTRTSIFNLTSMDIDMLGDASKGCSSISWNRSVTCFVRFRNALI